MRPGHVLHLYFAPKYYLFWQQIREIKAQVTMALCLLVHISRFCRLHDLPVIPLQTVALAIHNKTIQLTSNTHPYVSWDTPLANVSTLTQLGFCIGVYIIENFVVDG
jgi:hypothetical protein